MENTYRQSQQCVADIHKDTNQRIYSRNIPSQMLQPYLDVRPTMSKYSYFPIVEPRAKINVPLQQMPIYNIHNVFNPGNTHQLLFQENSFEQFNPNPDPNLCGSALFYNNTRCQVKDMTNQKC